MCMWEVISRGKTSSKCLFCTKIKHCFGPYWCCSLLWEHSLLQHDIKACYLLLWTKCDFGFTSTHYYKYQKQRSDIWSDDVFISTRYLRYIFIDFTQMIPGYMYVLHTLARHGEHLHQHDNRHAQTRQRREWALEADCTDQPLARTQRTNRSRWVILPTWWGVGVRRGRGDTEEGDQMWGGSEGEQKRGGANT